MALIVQQWTGMKAFGLGAGMFIAGSGFVYFGWNDIGRIVIIVGWLTAVVGIAITFVWIARNKRKSPD